MTIHENGLRVFYRKHKRPMWASWKAWKDCTAQERRQANLRTLWPDEIVLDIEDKKLWAKVRRRLAKYSYKAWLSGSRGVHVHITFPELAQHPKEPRSKIRKLFLELFPEADPCKASEATLISIEGKPHHKTGNPKTLLYDHLFKDGSTAKLPPGIVRNAKAAFAKQYTPIREHEGGGLDRFMQNPVVRYLKDYEGQLPEIPGQSRHLSISKNLAAFAVLCGLDEAQAKQASAEIAAKMQGKHLLEMFNWYSWFLRRERSQGKPAEYNRREMIKFLESVPDG